jgi:6-pyruvoyl tetrahydropterin synthase-like protein
MKHGEDLFEGYKFKYRLNAKHSFNGIVENIHPHTFEISLYIEQIQAKTIVAFSTIDKIVEQFLLDYQNQFLNELSPFNQLEPTIENMGDVFYEELKVILHKNQFNLLQLEISETPLRIYLVSDRLMFGSKTD